METRMNQWTRISIAGCLVLALGCGSDDDPVADDGTAATGAETTGGDTDTTGGGDTTTGDTDGGTTGDGTADGDDSGTTDGEPTEDQQAILDVEETKAFAIPGLKNEVHVLRTEHDIPHIYATDRLDLGHAVGFLLARDRYFVMDLARRLGNGNISSLLGDVAIENDVESRLMGMDVITQQMRDNLDADTEAYLAAVAAGINTYIAHVKAGDLPGPSELDLAGPLLGADNPADLMEEFTVRDLCATGTAVLFNLNYETDDVGRTAKAASLPTAFEGQDKEELRKESFLQDMWFNERPIFPGTNSMPGFGLDTAEPAGKPGAPIPEQSWAPQNRSTNLTMLNRLATRLQGWQDRRKRDRDKGYGSNTWAVNADKTADGWALVAGDGHLSLSVPALFWRMGFDTTIMGGGDLHQVGMLITGMYVMSVGTNGHVGFSGVNPVADITDWYREEIQLDSEGAPAATMFQGEWKPLSEHEETFEIADIPALSSVGRTEVHKRWVTFDGRWLRDIEGRAASSDETLAAGETLVNLGGDWVVPGDEDGDGVVTAVSFDFTGFDVAQWLKGNDLMGRAKDVTELREAAKYTT
ncbi:MAG: penicillin amidase, partial [Myxococcota bacterium]